jgi:DNA-directed RNA polymerase subunit K/omega
MPPKKSKDNKTLSRKSSNRSLISTQKSGKFVKHKNNNQVNVSEPIKLSDTIDYGVDGDDETENHYENDDDDDDDDEKDEIPELTSTDDIKPLKEKYKYNPVIRTEIVYVTPNNRKSSEIMTKFEFTEIISIRSKQIENGGSCFTDTYGLIDPIERAEKELRDRKCPLDIARSMSSNVSELWHANEMGINYD